MNSNELQRTVGSMDKGRGSQPNVDQTDRRKFGGSRQSRIIICGVLRRTRVIYTVKEYVVLELS